MRKVIIPVAVGVVFLVAIIWYSVTSNSPSPVSEKQSEESQAQEDSGFIPADWPTYHIQKFNLTIRYPKTIAGILVEPKRQEITPGVDNRGGYHYFSLFQTQIPHAPFLNENGERGPIGLISSFTIGVGFTVKRIDDYIPEGRVDLHDQQLFTIGVHPMGGSGGFVYDPIKDSWFDRDEFVFRNRVKEVGWDGVLNYLDQASQYRQAELPKVKTLLDATAYPVDFLPGEGDGGGTQYTYQLLDRERKLYITLSAGWLNNPPLEIKNRVEELGLEIKTALPLIARSLATSL